MRLLTCSLVLLGAFAIPAWTVNPFNLRLEEAKLRATALKAKAKANVAKTKSQLSVPTPSPPKQRGKRQDFFVPDVDYQDGFQLEYEPATEQIRLSKKKVLPDNAEYHYTPHFHAEEEPFDLTSRDDQTQYSCLCKKLEQLNHDVDNRVDVERNAQEFHVPIFHNPDENLHFQVHGPGVPGIVPVLDASNFEQFHDVEFPRDAHHHSEFHHRGGLPEDFGQPIMVNQEFREAANEEPINQEEAFENLREAHFHKNPHHSVIHHHQPHHSIHKHKGAHHQHFGHPIHQHFRQAGTSDEEFQPVFDDGQNQFEQNADFNGFAVQTPLGQTQENLDRSEHSRDLQNIKALIDTLKGFENNGTKNNTAVFEEIFQRHADELSREAHHHHPHHSHKGAHHQHFGHPIHQKFRQAEENSTSPDETSIFDEFRDIDPIEPDLNDNQDQQLRSFGDEEFQPVFDDGQNKFEENADLDRFAVQTPLGQTQENLDRSEHSRDLQNIKALIDILKQFDKVTNGTKNATAAVEELFQRHANELSREAHNGFAVRTTLGQTEENSDRSEHSRDLQNIKGLIDTLKRFDKVNNGTKNATAAVEELFQRHADELSREAHQNDFAVRTTLGQTQENSDRSKYSRDLQNIKGLIDTLKSFDKTNNGTSNVTAAVEEIFQRQAENLNRSEHSRDWQNIKGLIDNVKRLDKANNGTSNVTAAIKEIFLRHAEERSRETHQNGFAVRSPLGQTQGNSDRSEHSRDLQNIKGLIDTLKRFDKANNGTSNVTAAVEETFQRHADENSDRSEHSRDLQNIKALIDTLKSFDKVNNGTKNATAAVEELFQRQADELSREAHNDFAVRTTLGQTQENSDRSEHSRDLQNIKGLIDTLKRFDKVNNGTSNFSAAGEIFQRHAEGPGLNSQEFLEQDLVPQLEESQVRDAHLHHHTLIHNHRGLHHQAQVVVPEFGHGAIHQTGIVPGFHQGGHQSTFQQTGFHHSGFQQGHQQGFQQQGLGGHQPGFQQQGLGGHQSGFQQQSFQQSGLGGHQSAFQQQAGFQQGLRPNTLIRTNGINQRMDPEGIAPEEIQSSQDDTSSQVFDPFHEKDTTMDFLNRHQFDLPHPGFRNIEQSSRQAVGDAEEFARDDEVSSRHAEDAAGNSREARTFDPRDLFGDTVFNMLADFERQNPQMRNGGEPERAEEAKDARTFDPSDLFSEDAFPNFMSDLARQNQGRGDFITNDESMHRNVENEMQDVQQNGNERTTQVASPYLFNVPRNLDWQRKKRSMLDQILEKERHLVDAINNKSRNEDLNFIGQLGDRLLGDIERRRNLIEKLHNKTKELKPVDPRSRLDLHQIILEHRLGQSKKKRSIPLMRMISDPKVKLDLPKTMENFGTATKNVFEDEKAPMYHVKHLLGSSRNAVLSAMKIPPQNIIIPSDYEIVKKDPEEVSSEEYLDERDPLGFAKTFKKVGNIVRNSILSSHETANHIGEIAQDVKNVLHTVKHAAPRLILPYSQIPAIHHPPHKAMLITPRILDLTQAKESQAEEDRKLVKLGHIMDAVGISKPGDSKLALDKIVFEPHYKRPPKPPSEKLVQLYSRFQDNTLDTVGEAVNALEDAKVTVGAKNLHDFLEKMRNALNHNTVRAAHHKHKSRKQQKDEEIDKFVAALFDDSKNETVGAGLPLARELWQPFMGRASQTQLKEFQPEPRRASGHRTLHHRSNHKKPTPSSVNNETVGAFIEFLRNRDEGKTKRDDHKEMSYVLGAINPMMFERMYNETLHVKNTEETVTETKQQEEQKHGDQDSKVGTIMALSSAVKKPFMGQANPSAVREFLNTYNGDMGEIEARDDDEDIQEPIVIDGGDMQD